MFLQIHALTSYPASLLNRDDAGLAKRIPFGDTTRLRVSSQCLKRHWREALVDAVPQVPDGLRSTHFFTREVLPRVIAGDVAEDLARSLTKALADLVIKGGVEDDGRLKQPVLFGLREAEYFSSLVAQAAREGAEAAGAIQRLTERLKSREEKKNIDAMKQAAAGLTAALFGRMVTSDLLARVDAPVHVAHAFTVHAGATEMDYFTVVDDLARPEETGGAHLGQTELGAGVYYVYVVVDVPLLVSNLTGVESRQWKTQDPDLARKVLAELVQIIARQSPGAKLGSTAPYAYADLLLLEAGAAQPRTLGNAFLQAVPMRDGHITRRAARDMGQYLQRIDTAYGRTSAHRALTSTLDGVDFHDLSPTTLDAAVSGTLDALWS